MGTVPTRVDQELFDSARTAGATHSRSAAQQLVHWARLGRELSGPAQALVRTAWSDEIADRTAALDFEEERQAEALPWSEADADGNVVVRNPDAP